MYRVSLFFIQSISFRMPKTLRAMPKKKLAGAKSSQQVVRLALYQVLPFMLKNKVCEMILPIETVIVAIPSQIAFSAK